MGLRRDFAWHFVVADVQFPIIGRDLLSYYGLLVDCRNNRLPDRITSLAIPGRTAPSSVPSVKVMAAGTSMDNLLQEFPGLTTPAGIPRKVPHSTTHHIRTTPGPPVACRPHRLDPKCLSIAKAEFDAMLQDGTTRRAEGPCSSVLHLVPKKERLETLWRLPHGITKAYLHWFHLSEDAKCKCGHLYQSMNHILFHCEEINDQRELLKQKMGKWPASKEDLITKYKKEFCEFTESIDFEDLKV